MGLDQWISIKIKDQDKDVKIMIPDELKGIIKEYSEEPIITKTTEYEIAYWRKFNALQRWIDDNYTDGADTNCQDIELLNETVDALYEAALEVLIAYKTKSNDEFEKVASTILPTGEGFFFGSTKYDNFYIEDVTKLANVMKSIKELKANPRYEYAQIIYQASW